jgi:hypothetical protein
MSSLYFGAALVLGLLEVAAKEEEEPFLGLSGF